MGIYTETLLEAEGFDSMDEMLEVYALDSVVPGVCKDKDCLGIMDVEPDQTEGWCSACEKQTIVSCLVLWGIN